MKRKRLIDMIGDRYGYLVVIGTAPSVGYYRAVRVRCDCGAEKDVRLALLTRKVGGYRSCGCQQFKAAGWNKKDVAFHKPNGHGYVDINRKEGRGLLHRMIAAAALGKPLPEAAVVHHVEDVSNNLALVVCPDNSYHMLIYARERALDACGNPDHRKCKGGYDDPANMRVVTRKGRKNGTGAWHEGLPQDDPAHLQLKERNTLLAPG
jgi:hypothetical protein